jgi:protein TonB
VAQATPPPAVVQQQPAPQPVAPAPAPVQPPVTETHAPAPAPAQVAPAAAVYHEGDLVPAGTEGLVAGRMIHRGNVPYPPIAKMNRVEGVVILSVLISETGKVLDVRVIRPISRPVGLNEAAVESVKRSTFSAPTKDGMKVKSWTTVPVEFKL